MTAQEAAVPRYTALQIAELIGRPAPTVEQAAVIEAPLVPALVVAGAGSGKTETMALRITWLIANEIVAVPEVLGLTFTRKAAGELAARVNRYIELLHEALAERGDGELDLDPLQAPTISTYNAFASSLFREYSALIGREADATVIGEASAWALARRVLVRSTDERLVAARQSLNTLVDAVLRISRALGDNDAATRTDEIAAMVRDFEKLVELDINDETTTGRAKKRSPAKELVEAVADVSQLPLLLELAAEYAAEKRRHGYIEFSDQVALALEICRRLDRVPREYRDRFRVVILDEYQDTSVVQTDLLSGLFGGHAVMAVGDPNQSIYGWRGASAANLARFHSDFSAAGTDRFTDAGRTYSLSVSWRNHSRVLEAANAIVSVLPETPGVPVVRLAAPEWNVGGDVSIDVSESTDTEADAVALWMRDELARPLPGGGVRSGAILFRSLRTHGETFIAALERHGVPYHVLGLSGLLDQPVIVDLVCTLRVLHDPSAGSELVRLLAGARWQIGARDLRALRDLARWLGDRDHRLQLVSDEVKQKRRESAAVEDTPSLVDALDFLETAPDGHGALAKITPEGRARMREAAQLFTSLRRRAGLDLQDFVGLVIQELGLDLEAAAHDDSPLAIPSLEAFTEQITAFLSVDEFGTIGAFLGWLEEAEKRENLSPRSEEPEPGTVQLLTIHGSKGLEWDSVAVPRMVAGELPSAPKSRRGWTSFGELPFEFRGDAQELPELRWREATSQPDYVLHYTRFTDAVSDQYSDEQRRLAYVAVTRAKDALLLAGSFWSGQLTKPREPGTYLQEVAEALPETVAHFPDAQLPRDPEAESNPLVERVRSIVWPKAPLGQRRAAVEAAAEAVRAADPALPTPWSEEIELLLAERARKRSAPALVELPARVPASRFKDFVGDPGEVAARLARPLPERPYRQTRLGTLFHEWVENRSGVFGAQETIDADPFLLDLDDDEAGGTVLPAAESERRALKVLQDTFEASEWANLKPIAVEIEINFVMNDQIIICKLDAVYEREGRYQVVDWKTGRAPKNAQQMRERQYQLALYREAYAQLTGIDPELIDAVFYYVADDAVLRPENLSSAADLAADWERAVGAVTRR